MWTSVDTRIIFESNETLLGHTANSICVFVKLKGEPDIDGLHRACSKRNFRDTSPIFREKIRGKGNFFLIEISKLVRLAVRRRGTIARHSKFPIANVTSTDDN